MMRLSHYSNLKRLKTFNHRLWVSKSLTWTRSIVGQFPSSSLGGSGLREARFLHPSTQGTSRPPLAYPPYHSRAGADASAFRGAAREVTNSDPPKYTNPESSLPPLSFTLPPPSSKLSPPGDPRSRRSGTVRFTPGAGRSSAEKPVRSAECGEKRPRPGLGRRGCPSQLPTCQPTHPPRSRNSLLASASGVGPPGSSAAGCSGWTGSAGSGRSGEPHAAGSEEGRGRGWGAEPGARSPERRRALQGVRERLGAHGSLSRGASRRASDLSTAGKASVGAPPPLPPPLGAAHPALAVPRVAGEAGPRPEWTEPRPESLSPRAPY